MSFRYDNHNKPHRDPTQLMTRTIRAALGCALLAAILLGSLAARAATRAVVRDVNSTVIAMSSYPAPLAVLNGKMLFGATDETGPGLWMTDGAPAGTQLLKRLQGGASAPATVTATSTTSTLPPPVTSGGGGGGKGGGGAIGLLELFALLMVSVDADAIHQHRGY